MDEFSKVVEASIAHIEESVASFPSDEHDDVSSSFRYFAEFVIGLSASRLLPYLMDLRKVAESGAVDPEKVQLASIYGKTAALRVKDENGNWFGASWHVDEERPVTRMTFYAFDHREFGGLKFVATASILDEPDRMYASGKCRLDYFGLGIAALQALHKAVGSPAFALDHEGKRAGPMMLYSDHTAPLAFDGGIAGKACREIGARTSRMAAVATMNWADAHFEGIVDGLRAAGAEWGRAHLEWNDLDSGVCVLPTGANGETSIVHCNISLMSDYRIYALSKRTDGVLSLFALKAGSKDFDAMLATVIEGEQSLEPIAVKRGAEVTLMREFDTTEVIDAAGFSTRVVRDLVTGKLDVGAELKTDFDKFRTSYDDDELDSDGDDFEVSVRAPSV